MSLTLLPELYIKILCHLDPKELCVFSLVNTYGHYLCTSEEFFRSKLCNYFDIDVFKLNKDETYKKIFIDIFSKYNPTDKSSLTNIFDICWDNGYVPIIKALIKKYPMERARFTPSIDKINFNTSMEEFGGRYGDSDNEKLNIMEQLCDCGLDIKFISGDLIYYYTENNDINGLKKWLSKGLSLDDPSCIALRTACSNGYDELAQFCINNGANINIGVYTEDWSPLIYAVKYCSVETVKMLIEKGAKDDVLSYSIFGKEIWKGGEMLDRTTPSKEMLEYLASSRV